MPSPVKVIVHPPGHLLVARGAAREFLMHKDEFPPRLEISGDLPAQRIAEIACEQGMGLTPAAASARAEPIEIARVPILGTMVGPGGKLLGPEGRPLSWPDPRSGSPA